MATTRKRTVAAAQTRKVATAPATPAKAAGGAAKAVPAKAAPATPATTPTAGFDLGELARGAKVAKALPKSSRGGNGGNGATKALTELITRSFTESKPFTLPPVAADEDTQRKLNSAIRRAASLAPDGGLGVNIRSEVVDGMRVVTIMGKAKGK